MGGFLFLHFAHEPSPPRFPVQIQRVSFSFQRILKKTGKGIGQPDARFSFVTRAAHFADANVQLAQLAGKMADFRTGQAVHNHRRFVIALGALQDRFRRRVNRQVNLSFTVRVMRKVNCALKDRAGQHGFDVSDFARN